MTSTRLASHLDQRKSESPPTILCIDDDPDVTRSIELILSNYEVNVVRDCCGRLGICDVHEQNPDLIITDMRMPDGDGEHLLEQVKQNARTAHIPVIVLTGLSNDQLPGRMRNLGAASFLQKPVHSQTLLSEIGRFISLSELDWAAIDENSVNYNK